MLRHTSHVILQTIVSCDKIERVYYYIVKIVAIMLHTYLSGKSHQGLLITFTMIK